MTRRSTHAICRSAFTRDEAAAVQGRTRNVEARDALCQVERVSVRRGQARSYKLCVDL
jgi:hypothetical protein